MELKKEERRKFLGQFRERVLVALTGEQVEESGTYPQVLAAIKDQAAEKLIIDRRVDMEAAREYIELARDYELSFKRISSAQLKGPIRLVVVSGRAVNREDIFVADSDDDLETKELPHELIAAKGEKICSDCYRLVEEEPSLEAKDYDQFSWLDKLLGASCPGDHED